ncbi:MAG: DUF1674 domain-containing protein [Alphaproteobacteria bacterium]|nr:DUF1674 domain-containing protein [Alphaproteobacteria bacterium]
MTIEKEPAAINAETAKSAAVAGDREPERALSAAALRALAEAEERRAQAERALAESEKAKEVGGRDGPEPTRYGDWEKGGIVSDF